MKLVLKIIAGLLALIIIAAIALPMFISAEYLKGQLQQQVKAATGRDLTIKGDVSLKVLPSIAVDVEDVTSGNPAGFTTPYLVHIGKLSVGAALKPLLSKELRVTGITLDNATLNLEETAGGAKNWAFAKKATAADKTAPTQAEKSSGKSPLVIDQITIKNTKVHYRKGGSPMRIDAADINTTIAMDGGRTKINLSNALLYSGTAKADVTLEGNNVALDLALDGIQIEPLMTALTGASKMKGAAKVNLNVNGKGQGDALMRSLHGSGDIKINDGAIKGIDIANFLRNAKSGFTLGNSPAQSTDFTELTASYKIAQGVVSNDDLAMKSPVLRLGGKGSISLPAKTINYRAVPTIVGTLKGQGGEDAKGLEIPLLITGPWSAISVTPDVAGLIQEGLKNPEALKQNLKDINSTIKDYNSPKDIGAALFGKNKKAEEPAPVAAPATVTPATEPAAAPATTTPAAPAEPAPAKKEKVNVEDLLKGFAK